MSVPLLVTRDDDLLDDVLRLAAAAGTTLDVAHDPPSALRGWGAASLVLLGADLAPLVAEQPPARRAGVFLVAPGRAHDGLFRSALAAGAGEVLELPAAEAWLVELLTDAADGGARGARTVAVVGGGGGAGATTFAAALALTAARSGPAMLLDLDPLGPGLDHVVGLEVEADAAVRWDGLIGSHGRLGSRSLRDALPGRDGLVVLTWAAGSSAALDDGAVREVLSAARRGHDTVVVDLPRHVDDLVGEVVSRCDDVLVVVDGSVPSVASAGKVTEQLRPWAARLGAVVRSAATSVPPDQVAGVLDLPLVAELPRQRRLAEHLDLGLGPVHSRRSPLARASVEALGVLSTGETGMHRDVA
jgi:secretion/DNA translocation related CpaE-like protein